MGRYFFTVQYITDLSTLVIYSHKFPVVVEVHLEMQGLLQFLLPEPGLLEQKVPRLHHLFMFTVDVFLSIRELLQQSLSILSNCLHLLTDSCKILLQMQRQNYTVKTIVT